HRQPDATTLGRELHSAMSANLTQPFGRSGFDPRAGQATQVVYPPAVTVQQSGPNVTVPHGTAYQTAPPPPNRPTGRDRPEEQKSKTGLIVAGVLSLLILIGLGVIAYLVMTNRRRPEPQPNPYSNPQAVQPITPTPLPTNSNRAETPVTPAPTDAKGKVETKN